MDFSAVKHQKLFEVVVGFVLDIVAHVKGTSEKDSQSAEVVMDLPPTLTFRGELSDLCRTISSGGNEPLIPALLEALGHVQIQCARMVFRQALLVFPATRSGQRQEMGTHR